MEVWRLAKEQVQLWYFLLLDLAMSVYNGHTDFSRLEMAPYERLS